MEQKWRETHFLIMYQIIHVIIPVYNIRFLFLLLFYIILHYIILYMIWLQLPDSVLLVSPKMYPC